MIKNKIIFISLLLTPFNAIKALQLRPIPWVTHEAYLFLDNFMQENPSAKILEFGSGASTLWFAQRTESLVSVEHSPEWFKKVSKLLENNPSCLPVELILHKRPYYMICDTFPENYFDLILVDGRNRSGCIKNAIRTLKSGGVLMLDNAERKYYKKATNLLVGWKKFSTTQPKPDSCGFTYPNWKTDWYIKP